MDRVDLRERAHPRCFACASGHPMGLHLSCDVRPDGSVAGRVILDERFEGYPGTAHGGIVATLLDSAMAQCLFAAGRRAVTGDLQVRFRHSLELGVATEVRARLVESSPPLFRLHAEIRQRARTVALGRGVFVDPEEALAASFGTGPAVEEQRESASG